jgi:hypothetical protein
MLTSTEHETLETAAKFDALDLAPWARRILLDAAKSGRGKGK